MIRTEVQTFTVTGRGPFPFDMLRYDSCYPAHVEDAVAMDYTSEPSSLQGLRSVTLESAIASSPTIQRWESFGWCIEVEL